MSKGSISGSSSQASSLESEPTIFKSRGFCKFFDGVKGYGYISLNESGSSSRIGDVFFHHTVLVMDGYRAIGVGEEVSVEYFQNERNKLEARRITGPDGLSPCLGTGIKKPKKLERCYNCFEKGHHIRECSNSTAVKTCYLCREAGHIKSECPKKSSTKGIPILKQSMGTETAAEVSSRPPSAKRKKTEE